MILEFFRFELRLLRTSWLFWIIAAICSALAFSATSSDAVQIGGAIGNVYRNAPLTVIFMLSVFSLLGMFLTVTFVASPLLRDHEVGSADMVFSKPFPSYQLVLGRLFAGVSICVLLYILIALGIWLASFAPWVDPARIGPTRWDAFGFAIVFLITPNVMFVSAIFAAIAVRFRSLMAVYVAVIALFVGWVVAGSFMREADSPWLVALADPFGLRALSLGSRYWSAAQSNTQLPELIGYLGANRLLWLAVAGTLFFYAMRRFSPFASTRGSATSAAKPSAPDPANTPIRPNATLPLPLRRGTTLTQLWHLLRFDTRFVLLSMPFLAMLLFGLVNFFGSASSLAVLFGTRVYPVSAIMVDAIQGGLQWLLALIVSFYAGELVWRERSAKVHEIVDACPIQNSVPISAKIGALLVVILIFSLLSALAGMVFQLTRGYSDFEPWVYFSGLLVTSIPYILIGLLAVALQVITGNKFFGYGAIILVFVCQISFGLLGLGHNLLVFGGTPNSTYSDMNQWGASVPGIAAFAGYWLAFVAMLLIVASAFWTRGVAGTFAERWQLARSRLRGANTAALAVCFACFVGLGAWLWHQSTRVNVYLTPEQRFDRQAQYERQYRALETQPQLRVIGSSLKVDLFPKAQRAEVSGELTLQNRTDAAITELIVQAPQDVELTLTLPEHTILLDDTTFKLSRYKLKQAVAPGAELRLPFKSVLAAKGIRNEGAFTKVVNNGTFINNFDVVPRFGYQPQLEITDQHERRKRDLGPPRRMPKLEDQAARANTYLANDSDWIKFDAIVSTDPDQVALAPGYLQREWQENGRRYFHYTMDQPILNFYSFLSARWKITKGQWQGLPIEVYHHPAHDKNVQGMIRGVQKSLDYYTKNFSPYQHKQVRIVEFPRYASFAQAFPNTIPYSESIGFIADVRDPDAIDYPFYVTAHEIAHQWWAHQVIGANVQGSTMMSESLAQYSALMVMEQEYGPQTMRRFLKYELDNYLRSRGGEINEELPLYRVENQPYIHYRKGSLVFYRLRDELGEATLNQALAEYIKQTAYQGAPFTISTDLISIIRARAPADKQQLITDLFERISFYDNRVEQAGAKRLENGKYEVTLTLSSKKFYADGKGAETAAAMNDDIDVAVFGAGTKPGSKEPKVLYLAKHRITQAAPSITVVVDELPTEAGFDPFNKLIDRVSRDNRKAVSVTK